MSNSDSDSSTDGQPRQKKRKGVRNTHRYEQNIQKQSRLHGQSYISTTNKRLVKEKSNTDEECTCKKQCTLNYGLEERQQILKNVYNGRPKNEQDTYLTGLIEKLPVARRRNRNEIQRRANTFAYFILSNSERIQVCRKAFSVLHAIGNKAIFRLTSKLAEGTQPEDKRGKHIFRTNAIPQETIQIIDEHIRSYPLKQSHYSTRTIQYLDANLNIKTMHDMFLVKHPELNGIVRYDFFRNHYNTNHGYRFGRPQVDVCSTCEELDAKIKSATLNENAKRVAVAEKLVHIKRAKKFYNKQKEVQALCQQREDVGALVFDYMQNLPLPKIPVQEMFYLRKLWLFVFCVHDLKTNLANFYTYSEGEAKRGPDEVCSLLWKTIQNMDPAIKELHVFSDACGGQNRNNTLIRFFLTLITLGRFKKIYQYFPIRGHSFLQCDRNFGTAKRLIRRADRIYTPNEYNLMISTAKKTGFVVTNVKSEDILDFKNSWPQFYKKTCKSIDKATTYLISKYRHLEYSSNNKGYLVAHEYIDGLAKYIFLLQKPNTRPELPSTKAYNNKVPINTKKMDDIRKIVQYVPDDKKHFYEDVLTWPTTATETVDEE